MVRNSLGKQISEKMTPVKKVSGKKKIQIGIFLITHTPNHSV